MRFYDILVEINAKHDELTEMYLKHVKSCFKCIKQQKCGEEVMIISIIEQIEPIHYQFFCID